MTPSSRPFRRILAPLDDSSCAQRALFHALSLVHAFRAEVNLLHVIEHPDMERLCAGEHRPQALTAVEQAAKRYLIARSKEDYDLEGSVRCRTRCAATAATAILEEAVASNIDLIVIGTRGRNGTTPSEIGCTVSKVVRQAPCPVLTIGPVGGRVPEFAQRILVPVDFSPASMRALRLADAIARRLDAKLLVLHVVEPLPRLLDLRGDRPQAASRIPVTLDRAREKLETLVAEEVLAAPYQLLTTCDRSADGILVQARRYDAHLIVQGAQGRTAQADVALGGVAAEIVRRAACPVITVKDRAASARSEEAIAMPEGEPSVPENAA